MIAPCTLSTTSYSPFAVGIKIFASASWFSFHHRNPEADDRHVILLCELDRVNDVLRIARARDGDDDIGVLKDSCATARRKRTRSRHRSPMRSARLPSKAGGSPGIGGVFVEMMADNTVLLKSETQCVAIASEPPLPKT